MKKIRKFAIFAVAATLLGVTVSALEAAENRWVRIINRSSSPIRYLYASNVDRGTWEEDLLGPLRVIGTNSYLDANIDDRSGHCLYDIKAVLYDERVAIRRNFNVCANETFTVTD